MQGEMAAIFGPARQKKNAVNAVFIDVWRA